MQRRSQIPVIRTPKKNGGREKTASQLSQVGKKGEVDMLHLVGARARVSRLCAHCVILHCNLLCHLGSQFRNRRIVDDTGRKGPRTNSGIDFKRPSPESQRISGVFYRKILWETDDWSSEASTETIRHASFFCSKREIFFCTYSIPCSGTRSRRMISSAVTER